MQDRLLRFAAILLLGSLPAVAHAEFIDYFGNLVVDGFKFLFAAVFILILISIFLRSPKQRKPPEQWPPKE